MDKIQFWEGEYRGFDPESSFLPAIQVSSSYHISA